MASRYSTINKRQIELCRANGTLGALKDELVEELVAERYTLKQEVALLRQRDTKPTEFAEYNAYVEQCKAKVKALLGI